MPTEWADKQPGGGGMWKAGLDLPEDEMQAARERRQREEEMPGDYDSDCSEFGAGEWAHDPSADLESDEQPPAADQPDKPLPAVEQPAAPSSAATAPSSAAPSAIIPSSNPPPPAAPSVVAQSTKANVAAGRGSPADGPSPPVTTAPPAILPPHLRATGTQSPRAPQGQTSTAKFPWRPPVAVPLLPRLRPRAPDPPIAKDPTNPDTKGYCCHADFMKGCPNCEFLDARTLFRKANVKVDGLKRQQETLKAAFKTSGEEGALEEFEPWKMSKQEFDKCEARRVELHARSLSLRAKRDKFKAESATKPDVWDDAVKSVLATEAKIRKDAYGNHQEEQPLPEFTLASEDTDASSSDPNVDRTAIAASADYILDMPYGCRYLDQHRQRDGGFDPLLALGQHGGRAMMAHGSTFRADVLGLPTRSVSEPKRSQNDVADADDPWAHEEQEHEAPSSLEDDQVISEAAARRKRHSVYGTEQPALSHSQQLDLFRKVADPYYLTTLFANQTETVDQYTQQLKKQDGDDSPGEDELGTEPRPLDRLRTVGGLCSWMQNKATEIGGFDQFNEMVQDIQHATETYPLQNTKPQVLQWRLALPEEVKAKDPDAVTVKDDKKTSLQSSPAEFLPPGEYPRSYKKSPRATNSEDWEYWKAREKNLPPFPEWRRKNRPGRS